jgi:hypothetical protein
LALGRWLCGPKKHIVRRVDLKAHLAIFNADYGKLDPRSDLDALADFGSGCDWQFVHA